MQTITITKEVDHTIGVEKVTCSACGSDMEIVKLDIDSYEDLLIEVEPCECQRGMV